MPVIDGVNVPEGAKQGQWIEGRHFWDGKLGPKGVIMDPSADGFKERVSEEVNVQSDLAVGYTPGTIKDYLNLGELPQFGTAGDATKFANAAQDNFTGVQSREDIKAGLEGELGLGERPEVPSMLESFTTQKTEAGLDTLQEEINELTKSERDIVAQRRIRQQAEKDKPEALGVIGGRVSEIERQEGERLDVINREKAYKVDQYNSALSSIQMIMSFTQQDYDNATNSFNSQFTQGLQMINAVSGIEESQKTDAQRAMDNANATLGVMSNAITSGNLSYSDLSSDEKLNISKLEARAGLPIGFVSSLKMNPGDKILNINSETGEALVIGENGEFEVKKTGMTISPKSLSTGDSKASDQSDIITFMNQVKGGDGYIDPKDWDDALESWLESGRTKSEFENNFNQFANPSHLGSYGLDGGASFDNI